MAKQKEVGGESEQVNDSIAGRALNRKPTLLRTVLYQPMLRLIVLIGFGVFFTALIVQGIAEGLKQTVPQGVYKGLEIVGAVIMLLSWGLALLSWFVWKSIKRNFANGLLSAGMVQQQTPLTIIVLANIGKGWSETATWGAVRSSPGSLPGHQATPLEKVPCVCTFRDGDSADHWGDVQPMPVCHGRGGTKILEQADSAIGEKEYKILQRLIEKGWIPEDDDHMVVIEEGGSPRTVERAEFAQRNAREAARDVRTKSVER